MTQPEQTAALQRFGYTRREAAFLATAALHSGYFVARQFSPVRGKVADRFCRKVLSYSHGTAASYANRTRLFHLSAKPLYAALGQTDNKHRRRRLPAQILAKLMALDFVLQHPGHRFLPTEDDKLRFFCGERGLEKSIFPTTLYAGKASNTSRFFVDKYPIRIDPVTGHIAFCFIDDSLFVGLGFAVWLKQYASLIRALGSTAEVIYIACAADTFSEAARLFSARFPTGQSAAMAPELLRYFETRKHLEATQFRGSSKADLDAYKAMRKTYDTAQSHAQYATWLSALSSPSLASSTALSPARFSSFELPHDYRIFSGSLAVKA